MFVIFSSSVPGKSFAIGQTSSLMSPLGMGNMGVGTGCEFESQELIPSSNTSHVRMCLV